VLPNGELPGPRQRITIAYNSFRHECGQGGSCSTLVHVKLRRSCAGRLCDKKVATRQARNLLLQISSPAKELKCWLFSPEFWAAMYPIPLYVSHLPSKMPPATGTELLWSCDSNSTQAKLLEHSPSVFAAVTDQVRVWSIDARTDSQWVSSTVSSDLFADRPANDRL
jgi:hypothetical protein